MSLGATMSILGLWNNDPTIFALMQLPEGFTDDDRETVTDSILTECAELEILYPAPAVMKNCIGIWSRKELPVWQRIYNASLLEYNPIENYRRDETETIADARKEEHSGTDTNTASGSDTNRASGTDSTNGNSSSTTTDGGTDTTQHDVTGYDSDTLVPSTKDTVTHGMTQTVYENASNSTTYGRTDTITHGRIDSYQHGEKIEHSGGTTRTNLAFGNIGVTTSQQMLTQEIDIAKIINVIPYIVDSFKDRFCIMVY